MLNSIYAPKINAKNFVASLTEFCEKIDNLTEQKINYSFKLNDIKLSQEECLHLYRIVSELTTNAIKYANATEINIIIYQVK